MKFEEITPEERHNYTTELVPRLAREEPGQWVRIDTIAKDVARFIAICQLLADDRQFDLPGYDYPVIEVYKDSLVRLDPDYMAIINNTILFSNENKIQSRQPKQPRLSALPV
jgi:hypothetical protein